VVVSKRAEAPLAFSPGSDGLMRTFSTSSGRRLCVLVGLSGGVDSAVAALLLKESGHRVIGVTLTLADEPDGPTLGRCCSPDTVARANAVAHHLGIPHYVIDSTAAFRREVVEYFVHAYARGLTPNPCTKCNSRVRFSALAHTARRLGADRIATGHYARRDSSSGVLARATDSTKDQSYVLAEVPSGVLDGVVFPLGTLSKREVREMAGRSGLQDLVAHESQEVCFVPNDDYRAFIRSRVGELPGPIIDRERRVVGRHTGTYNYTVGQRRGLGSALGQPAYVVSVDAVSRDVVIGPRSAVAVGALVIDTPVVHCSLPVGPVQLQFRSLGLPVSALPDQDGAFALLEPAFGVALGQTAVVYAGDTVILAGSIISTKPWRGPISEGQGPKSPVV
jgi:tRNA-specific 2-thiouridylase